MSALKGYIAAEKTENSWNPADLPGHGPQARLVFQPMRAPRRLQILKGSDQTAMQRACTLAAATLEMVASEIREGMTTAAIDRLVLEFTLDHGAYPAPLNYPNERTDPREPTISSGAFPRSVCTSVNEVVCHGIPSEKTVLKSGDIVNVDVTSVLDGFYGDTSKTFLIGEVSDEVRKLVDVAEQSMALGIAEVRPGGTIGDIGAAIQDFAERKLGYGVVREYCGHGIGRVFHADPQIQHTGVRGSGERMVAGMCFTVEPMINMGTWRTRPSRDGWTVYTADGKLSAQFEHTVMVTRDGVEILTDPAKVPSSEFAL